MATTISTGTGNGIYLTSPAYMNPVVVAPGVTVTAPVYPIYARSGYWTVINYGSVVSTGGTGSAIQLQAGGDVINHGVLGSPTENASGVYISGGPGAVTNAATSASVWLQNGGTVTNQAGATIVSGSTSGGYGVGLHAGGVITNAGVMTGLYLGVDADYAGGAVTNQAGGAISGQWAGVLLVFPGLPTGGPGDLVNQAGATIRASLGVLAGAGDTVTNAGTILGTSAGTIMHNGVTQAIGAGVTMSGAGTVDNQPGGTISGASYGVYFSGGGTLVDAGRIIGGNGTAVGFGGVGSGLLVLDPGFGLSGLAVGSPGAGDTLELASAASAGMLGGLGAQYLNFNQTNVDIGATWTLTGANTVSAGQTMTNDGSLKLFGATLVVDGDLVNNGTIDADPSSLTAAGIDGAGTLEIGANSTLTATGAVGAGQTIAFTGANAVLNVLHSGEFAATITGQGPTDQVNLACFAAGTRLLTVSGEIPVETLRIGDRVVTTTGQIRPIRWIGHRHVECARHPRPEAAWPVRVQAGAFGNNVPHRDLFLSPDHAVFADGALLPVRHLANGRTIAPEQIDAVTYYHVELSRHAVILAEGLPCESYLDTGNRAAFASDSESPARPPHPPALAGSNHMWRKSHISARIFES